MTGRLARILLVCLLLAGCRLQDLTPEQVGMITRSITATAKAVRPISDEEEYYVGRSVAARILAEYHLVKDRRLIDYVNEVGEAVALQSEKPFTYGGYHFAVIDTPIVNAFACPGGIIFITRGMVSAVRSEDELAAVLAHEVAHVNHRDGVNAIEKSRWTEAVTVIGTEAARTYGSQDVARLANIFEGSIDDVFKTLVVNGYGRTQELSADQTALTYLERAGYDPQALRTFLVRLEKEGAGGKGGMLQTHPGTADRIANVEANMPDRRADSALVRVRTERFDRILGRTSPLL